MMKERIRSLLENIKKSPGIAVQTAAILFFGCAVFVVVFTGLGKRSWFGPVSAAAGKGAAGGITADTDNTAFQEETGKLSYERMKNGDTMYCTYFGVLNVRSGPSEDAELVGQISYKDQVQAFWKEESGYVRIVYQLPHSDQYAEGYCLREALSEDMPSDARVYLAVHNYKQYDERWGGLPLGESYETIATAGCTTTCLAMAYSYLENSVTTPDVMETRLYYNSDGMLGFPKVYTAASEQDYASVIYDKLQQKIPVLVGAMRDNGSPHWVLVVGYCGDGTSRNLEDFVIHDPASEERTLLAEFFMEFPNYNKIAYYSGNEI